MGPVAPSLALKCSHSVLYTLKFSYIFDCYGFYWLIFLRFYVLMLLSLSLTHDPRQFGWSALHFAAHYGRADIAKHYIDLGAQVNAITPVSQTISIATTWPGSSQPKRMAATHHCTVRAKLVPQR